MLYSKWDTSEGGDYSSAETEMRCDVVEFQRSQTKGFEEQVEDGSSSL